MEEQEENQHNMISNLPLLFANGYPTSLDKITEKQLENFIPFMVQCSLGHINLQGKMDYSEPEWWPEDLPFVVPFVKPKKFTGDWVEKMKEIVFICYQFHKSIFLLRFCNDLASYEHASLRFINNYNSTTSLFDRRSSKLLVTFRNENMSYDQPQRSRKCLLQQKSKNDRQSGMQAQQMVEPAPFDIYLCDNCDAELYSKEAVLEHEKTCQTVLDDDEDDDVILCDTPEPCEISLSTALRTEAEDNELRKGFLLNFGLQSRESATNSKVESEDTIAMSKALKEENFVVLDKNRRMPRRNRNVHTISRCPTIPLSSPAGQLLLKSTKAVVPADYLTERLERMERFCHTPLLSSSKSSNRPKYLDRKFLPATVACTFKKPQDYSTHMYVFPRRQFSQKRRRENVLFLNSTLLKRCRPISVRLKKIKRELPNTKLNIKLTRDATRNSNWKVSSCSSEVIVDTIDLCSSDDDDGSEEVKSVHNVVQVVQRAMPAMFKQQIGATTVTPKLQLSAARTLATTKLTNSEISVIPLRKSNTANEILSERWSVNKTKHHNTHAGPDGNGGGVSIGINLREETVAPLPTPPLSLSLQTTAKALRPSLYIFSNNTALTNNSREMSTSIGSVNVSNVSVAASAGFRGQNQENHQAIQSMTTVRKRATIASSAPSSMALVDVGLGIGLTTTSITAPSAVNGNINNNNNIDFMHNNNNTSNDQANNSIVTATAAHHQSHHLLDKERSSRSLSSLAQKFNTPTRIISIDLTS